MSKEDSFHLWMSKRVMKKANNCWRVSCSNIYKVYSAKCLKKTRLIYECPRTFALTSDSHEVLYLHWIKIESKTSIFLRDFGYTSGTSKIFTIFALYSGFLSNMSIANDKLDSFEFLILSNTQRNDYLKSIWENSIISHQVFEN